MKCSTCQKTKLTVRSRCIAEIPINLSRANNERPLLKSSHSRRASAASFRHRQQWARCTHWVRQVRRRIPALEFRCHTTDAHHHRSRPSAAAGGFSLNGPLILYLYVLGRSAALHSTDAPKPPRRERWCARTCVSSWRRLGHPCRRLYRPCTGWRHCRKPEPSMGHRSRRGEFLSGSCRAAA